MVKIIHIAAVAENGVIGNDGRIPWHLPQDLQHFKSTTDGHPVVMGRRTYEGIVTGWGGPLADRPNIVLTSRDDLDVETPDRTTLVSTPGEALFKAVREAQQRGGRVFIGGGEGVYRGFLPLADELLLTEVDGEYDGDTYFLEWDDDEWTGVERQTEFDEFDIVRYERR